MHTFMLMLYRSYPQFTVGLLFFSFTSRLCDLLLFLDHHVTSSDKREKEECQWFAFNLGSSASNEAVSRVFSDLTDAMLFFGGWVGFD